MKYLKYSLVLQLFILTFVFSSGQQVEYKFINKTKVNKTIYDKIVSEGVKYPGIVYRQAILETGWFKSSIYKRKNNMFGFFYKGEFMSFKTEEDCINYYKRWQDKHYTDTSKNYYDFLNCLYTDNNNKCIRYAEDVLYTKKLKRIKIKNK